MASAEWINRDSFPADDPAVPAYMEQQRSMALDTLRGAESFLVLALEKSGAVRVIQAVHTDHGPPMMVGLLAYTKAAGGLLGLQVNPDEDEAE